jgi:hypothetical protein
VVHGIHESPRSRLLIVPQCQRSRLILTTSNLVSERCWRCPGSPRPGICAGAECYVDVTEDRWARDPFDAAFSEAPAEFASNQNREVRLWSGVHPQTILAPDGIIEVYLSPSAADPSWRPLKWRFRRPTRRYTPRAAPPFSIGLMSCAPSFSSLDHLERHGSLGTPPGTVLNSIAKRPGCPRLTSCRGAEATLTPPPCTPAPSCWVSVWWRPSAGQPCGGLLGFHI